MSHPDPKRKWWHMRWMAWAALGHALTCSFYIEGETLIASFLIFDAGVIGAFMGASTARDGWGKG